MCGIFAALSRRGRISTDYRRLLAALQHRGPDDSQFQLVNLNCGGTDTCDRAWLGHRRLSIIDLSIRGRQPMETPDGRLCVIFNGEIYNYVELRAECRAAGAEFTTETDTEVLLHAWRLWGEACLPRLKGMFAFVLVDRVLGKAVLVRDFFGIKPLYFAVGEREVLVCSEVLPLLECNTVGTELNADITYEYLRFGATSSNDRTILRDVQSLPPAHIAIFDFASGELETPRRFWSLEATRRTITFSDAVAECRDRFMENVRLHLRSDVPVGAALSGGIDSSAIVCAMRQLEPDLDLKTFSYIAADAAQSEERWVDLVHAQVGGECHKIRPTGDDLARDLALLVRHQGEPFGSASMFAQFRVFQRARAEGVPVTLDGQGADELLGGYWPYIGSAATERLFAGDIGALVSVIGRAAPGVRGVAMTSAMLAQNVLPQSLRSFARTLVGKEFVPTYFNREWLEATGTKPLESADALIGRYRTLKEHLIDTASRGSLPNLLRYADRNSMAASIESRVPFLTHDFAEFLMSLPPEFIISRGGVRKYVFREAMKGILPEPIRARSDKIGFFADDGLWLRENRHRITEVVEELSVLPMFHGAALRKFFDDFWNARHNKAQLVWRAVVFGYWRREVDRSVRQRAA